MNLQDEKVIIDIDAPDNTPRRFAVLLMKDFTLLSFASAVDAYTAEHGTNYTVQEARDALGQ